MTETVPEKIPSGTYRPNQDVELVAWNEGDDVPAGFDVQRTSDGSRIAVRMEFGDVARDGAGNAASLPEGGALATLPDGTYQTLHGEELERFLRIYKPVDGSASATADPVPVVAPTPPVQAPDTTQAPAPVPTNGADNPPAPVPVNPPAPVPSVQPDADHPLSPDGAMIWDGAEWVAYTAPTGG